MRALYAFLIVAMAIMVMGQVVVSPPTPPVTSSGLDQALGNTRGGIAERGASGWVNLPPGTSGLPFVSNGAGADPSYQALSAGGLATGLIPVIPDSFCTVDRTGATDMTTCINSAISAAKPSSCGAGSTATVYLRAGTYLINSRVIPQSCVTIRGDGPARTVLLTDSAIPFGPSGGVQLVHFSMDGLTFKDSGSNPGATVMSFGNIQDSRLTNLQFLGYSSGTIMAIATVTVTTFADTSTIWNNSNSIFNYFLNWQADSCAICISEAGAYGGTPTSSPPNSSNQPSQVVTQNRYDNIILWAVSNKCVDFVKAADTEFLTNIFCKTNSNSAVVAQFGDDNANFPGNNYVAQIHLQATQSLLSPATSVTMFRAGDWTYGHIIDLETDSVPSAVTIATAQANVTQFRLEVCGTNTVPAFIDGAGFNTNRLCQNNDFGSALSGQATYYRIGNGLPATPILGFVNDSADGLYLATAGIAAFSKSLRADVHLLGGASVPAVSACGASATISGNDNGWDVTVVTAAQTTCTITFANAYVNSPVCTVSSVGSFNSGVYISSINNTRVVLTFPSSSANQQFSGTCIGDNG